MFMHEPLTHVSAMHVCGVLGKSTESGLQRRSPVLHWEQVCVVELHTGVPPLQAVLPVHWPLPSQTCGVPPVPSGLVVPPHRVLPGVHTPVQEPLLHTKVQGLAA